MQNVFISRGTRYADDKTFDGYEIIANPLGGHDAAARESRVFRWKGPSGGTDYSSHTLSLAVPKTDPEGRYGLYILVEHGGGREVWSLRKFYDGGALQEHILSMPERLQYALLYTLYQMASESRSQARSETRQEWATAHVEKRIKTRRRNNRRYVEIVPQQVVAP